ncbi:MAG: hypothetical protein II885_16030 [Oscillospiraceae bacterium]|nr:hypothetical protein [Oscillospiraceae bacterium]
MDPSCSISLDVSSFSKRCFITGEYCSKQLDIEKKRKDLHDKKEITAFVIMNFSHMSDVVYKWRLLPFIETLTQYLYFDDGNKLVCSIDAQQNARDSVKHIHVVRADSNPSNNFVICNRVCQQLQIADLVIVDVSVANANVFYELGLAVALGKLILPLCYSESFYHMNVPDKLNKIFEENVQDPQYWAGENGAKANDEDLKHHIGCYPWRRELFEYFGIRYRSKDSYTQYISFDKAVNPRYGFSDEKYNRFPYHIDIPTAQAGIESTASKKSIKIGEAIYSRLYKTYNDTKTEMNTLIVYTMDDILNREEAGRCIVNYYRAIVQRLREEQCFCGDRVGVLIQQNPIPECDKDAPSKRRFLYSTGEIIHIGINQATYSASKNTIKPDDYLPEEPSSEVEQLNKDIAPLPATSTGEGVKPNNPTLEFLKKHMGNRAIPVYPSDPVYVDRVESGIQKDILKPHDIQQPFNQNGDPYFCLFTIMTRTLRYVDELAVDISRNSLPALFWLGIAHGSGVNAITIRHEESPEERKELFKSSDGNVRNIFDVAGLWTAVSRSNDIEGFYHQLALAQSGIEQRTKLMLDDIDSINVKLHDSFWNANPKQADAINDQHKAKEYDEQIKLESYYRDRFWRPMLCYNRLWIYLLQKDDKDQKDDDEPRTHAARWDVDAIAVLSHYLSKRKIIGEYQFKTLRKNYADKAARNKNFICVGQDVKPLPNSESTCSQSLSLAEDINKNAKNYYSASKVRIGQKYSSKCEYEGARENSKQLYLGFQYLDDFDNPLDENSAFTHTPRYSCYGCLEEHGANLKSLPVDNVFSQEQIQSQACKLRDNTNHTQLAQLLLWRERPESAQDGRVVYRVALSGVSGPSTLALTSLFVDKKQKKEILKERDLFKDEETPLLVLQAELRKQLIEKCIGCLDKIISDEDKPTWKYAIKLYLNATLYRYFLPFLSMEDEYRIINGMRLYLISLKSSKIVQFKNTSDEGFEEIIKTMNNTLKSLRGVEAMYQVQVEINHAWQDNQNTDIKKTDSLTNNLRDNTDFAIDEREVLSIRPHTREGNSKLDMRCLFFETLQ